jgi:hypothetical protein
MAMASSDIVLSVTTMVQVFTIYAITGLATTETMFTGLFSRTTGLTTTAILSMLTKII